MWFRSTWLLLRRVTPVPVLLSLWAVDAVLAVLFVATALGPDSVRDSLDPRHWSLDVDGSYPEMIGWLQEAAVVVLLAVLAVRTGRALFLGWVLVYVTVLLDDALSLHEDLGTALADLAILPEHIAGVRGQDLGELAAWGLVGALPVVVVALLHWRSDEGGRRIGRVLGALFGILIFCAVVLDAAHAALMGVGRPAGIIGVAEDTGELAVLSVTLAFVAGLVRLNRRHLGELLAQGSSDFRGLGPQSPRHAETSPPSVAPTPTTRDQLPNTL
jgi:hypothetical protein